MNEPNVTLVCVPRERFSFARMSLMSLYTNTEVPFRLVYVDNGSPRSLRHFLEEKQRELGFVLVTAPHPLSPNQARNLGLKYANTKYVVFIDNDVEFAPGWLGPLIECAEQTGATVVGPLMCQHEPLHKIIHCAGGEYMPEQELAEFRKEPLPSSTANRTSADKWRIREKFYLQGKRVADVQLKRCEVGCIEFHCLLIRRDFLSQYGELDEAFMATKEYVDLAMTVARAGGSLWLEPASRVTFRTHPPAPRLKLNELPYFMLRWSDRWQQDSLVYMRHKWDLIEDEYFIKRFNNLDWRRRKEIVRPLCERVPLLGPSGVRWLTKRTAKVERALNRMISNRYAKRVATRALHRQTDTLV